MKQPKQQSKPDNSRVINAALNISCAMMAKGIRQYPLGPDDVDYYAKESVVIAKRLLEQIEKEAK